MSESYLTATSSISNDKSRNCRPRRVCAIGEIAGNDQTTLADEFHRGNAFVPALDHAPNSNWEVDRLAAVVVGRVELGAIEQRACVIHRDRLSYLRICASPNLDWNTIVGNAGAKRAFEAMMEMRKIDVAKSEAAAGGTYLCLRTTQTK